MPLTLDGDVIDRLNRRHTKGKFLKTLIVTEDVATPPTKSYWVDHETSITFDGHVYNPLAMYWDQIKTSGTMIDVGAQVTVSNVGGKVTKYLKQSDITGLDVIMQQLHMDLLTTLTNFWKRKFKVLAVKADIDVAIFTLGRELGRNRLPRRLILPEEQG